MNTGGQPAETGSCLLQRHLGKSPSAGLYGRASNAPTKVARCVAFYAMLSDSARVEEPLQKATSRLAQTDLRILTSVPGFGS